MNDGVWKVTTDFGVHDEDALRVWPLSGRRQDTLPLCDTWLAKSHYVRKDADGTLL